MKRLTQGEMYVWATKARATNPNQGDLFAWAATKKPLHEETKLVHRKTGKVHQQKYHIKTAEAPKKKLKSVIDSVMTAIVKLNDGVPNVDGLSGRRNRGIRRDIYAALLGRKTTVAESGFNNVMNELQKQMGVKNIREVNDRLNEFAIKTGIKYTTLAEIEAAEKKAK